MARHLLLSLFLGPFSLLCIDKPTQGDDAANAERQWAAAKQRYSESLDKARQSVIEQLNGSDTRARAAGDLAKVKKIKSERDAFEDRGELPSGFDKATYNRRLQTAQDELKKAHKEYLAYLLKARRDDEAEELEKELQNLLSSSNTTGAPDHRTRWFSTSYKTIFYWVKDKTWAEVDEGKTEPKWYWRETRREPDYVELFLPARDETWRFSASRADLKRDGKWEWGANGYWVDSTGKRLSQQTK
jgi:hypothetical protein